MDVFAILWRTWSEPTGGQVWMWVTDPFTPFPILTTCSSRGPLKGPTRLSQEHPLW